MNDKLTSIQKLMEQHRFDEAGAALTALVESDEFVDEQGGGAYLTLYLTYMDALIQARERYNAALDAGIVLLKATHAREREMKEGIDLARLHQEIRALTAN